MNYLDPDTAAQLIDLVRECRRTVRLTFQAAPQARRIAAGKDIDAFLAVNAFVWSLVKEDVP